MTGGGRCLCASPRTRIGADGGCGTEEKPCPVSRVPFIRSQAKLPSNLDEITSLPPGIDFYTQARKAFSALSPFDSEDAEGTGNAASTSLPRELACLVFKQYDSRKRQKRSFSHKHNAECSVNKVSGSNFWDEAEEYFRPLTVDDIDRLNYLSSSRCTASNRCFWIPRLGIASSTCGISNGDSQHLGHAVHAEGSVLGDMVIVSEGDAKDEPEHLVQVDSAASENDSSSLPSNGDTPSVVQLGSGVEWLLGVRNKNYARLERPSKKRKLLDGDASLEKLLVPCPVEDSSLCHYCSLDDTSDQLNRLISCSCCRMKVHERCYGVQGIVDDSWLCSWCEQNTVVFSEYPCVLCPKQGGALKPIWKSEVSKDMCTSTKFAHLFCCQWMPEVYVEDTKKMEPILNVERIKETRRKLLCYLCKKKHGTCVRCSNGVCKASFHPICAREARHTMEIWGRLGCEGVELRAYCSKHSGIQNNSSAVQESDLQVVVDSDVKGSNDLKIGVIGDKVGIENGSDNKCIDNLGDDVSSEGWPGMRPNVKLLECDDAEEPSGGQNVGMNAGNDHNRNETMNFSLNLKQLVDQGKVNLKDVASDIGVTFELLASRLKDDCLGMALHRKIVNWIKKHGYMGTVRSNLKVKIKPPVRNMAELGVANDIDMTTRSVYDIPDTVSVKSLPPRRRTMSKTGISKDNKVICSPKDIGDVEKVIDVFKSGDVVGDILNCSIKDLVSGAITKVMDACNGFQNPMKVDNYSHEGSNLDPCKSERLDKIATISMQNTLTNSLPENPRNSDVVSHFLYYNKAQASDNFYIYPLIHNKLVQVQNGLLLKNSTYEYDGLNNRESSQLEASSSSSSCDPNNQHGTSNVNFDGVNIEKLVKDRGTDLLELSPVDEVEEELIYHQYRLLCNAVGRKHLSDNLIFMIMKRFSLESDAWAKRKWDAVLVNQYLRELREAKKLGRKERRQKEAQAVLAAATAAAAASSRNSSLRKDILNESSHREDLLKLDTSGSRGILYTQQRQKNFDHAKRTSDFSKEHSRICDICSRSETLLNPILICLGCKVAVHLDCYWSVKETTGPWYCELCQDLLSRNSGPLPVNSGSRHCLAAECGLCGGSDGAFRRSADGQWVHAFCAEWILESTFRRGQANLIEGMGMISKGNDVCHICSSRQGVCIKCNYGNCQITFHPSCARRAGLYMNVRISSGKLLHRAYCEKHSVEQKAKPDTQRCSMDELKSLKQVRVELERLRLLCERIIKREKLKRELLICSHGILASNRDSVALSALVRNPFLLSDLSSESATTSLKGYTEGCKSGSEAMQRSDDVTVDSTVAGKRCIKISMSMDNDQRTDDSSTSHHFTPKPTERVPFSGKQIPCRPSIISRNFVDDGETRLKFRKRTETFEKELIMTSDQASVKNQRLPKGFVYVPVRCISKENDTIPDPGS